MTSRSIALKKKKKKVGELAAAGRSREGGVRGKFQKRGGDGPSADRHSRNDLSLSKKKGTTMMANADDTTPLMAEIPLVIHPPPLPLATFGGEEEERRRSTGSRRRVVYRASVPNKAAAVGATTTAIGVELTDST